MEFECTNNTIEYEAPVLGLQNTISLNVVVLKVVGDLDIVVHQAHNTTHYVSPSLKRYQQEILHFMANTDIFKDATIDEDEHKQSLQDVANVRKGNLIPKGVVLVVKLYDLHNSFQGLVNAKTHSSTLLHEHINLGTDKDLKFVNIGRYCTLQERKDFIHLFK
eukprot:PITA_17659